MYSTIKLFRSFKLCYVGEETPPVVETPEAIAAKAAETAKDEADLPPALKGKTTFTQADVNFIAKEERLKAKTATEKHIKELENLKRSQTLSEKDKTDLQKRIDDMQNTLLTKEELAKKEKERLENQHKQTVQSISAEKELWQNRFTRSTINGSIISHAASNDAFNPDDLIAILGPNTRLVAEVDGEGKETDNFAPKVKFSDTGEDGKPIILDLTVPEAIKRMKEISRYMHLFKSTATGGLGAQANPTNPGQKVDVSKMTPAQYREYRKKSGMSRRPGQGT